jgi:phosphate transport system ATP-binding protein
MDRDRRKMPETADKTTETRSTGVATDLARTAEEAKGRGAARVERVAKRFSVKDVNLYYGNFQAVKGVSMTIEPNQVTALIGSSGCGKTTVLRSLNRMHELTPGARVEGEVKLDDANIYASAVDPVEVRRLVGMVFQAPNPFPTMSVSENVAAGLTLNRRGISKSEKHDIVEKSLRGAHLWEEVKDRLDGQGSGLSGGQQQRLCIARAIAVEPEVLLMDEPCSALDPVATQAIEDLIADLKTRYTIVIVTHNMQQAARVSDTTAFFNLEGAGKPGHLVEMDATDTIFTTPSKKETEDYVSGRFG